LRARGGFELDMVWERGTLTEALLTSLNGNVAVVKCAAFEGDVSVVNVADNTEIEIEKSEDTITFSTAENAAYKITVD
jgi:hypothetical protein